MNTYFQYLLSEDENTCRSLGGANPVDDSVLAGGDLHQRLDVVAEPVVVEVKVEALGADIVERRLAPHILNSDVDERRLEAKRRADEVAFLDAIVVLNR